MTRLISWRGTASRTLPRVLALMWAIWCTWTLMLYIPPPPPQLAPLNNLIPTGLWLVWAVPAFLLTAGALVPTCAPCWQKKIARNMRSAGLFIVSVLLVVWAWFYITDSGTVYSSHLAKNYLALAIVSLFSAWFIGRETASVEAAQEGGDVNG